MQKFLKENFLVAVALTLPLVVIGVIAAGARLPVFNVEAPDFVYSLCAKRSYGELPPCNEAYHSVVNGKLVINDELVIDDQQILNTEAAPNANETEKYHKLRFFRHHTSENENTELTAEQVRALTLDDSLLTPDGVGIMTQYTSAFARTFFDMYPAEYDYHLTKEERKRRLRLSQGGYNVASQQIQFVGWVVENTQ